MFDADSPLMPAIGVQVRDATRVSPRRRMNVGSSPLMPLTEPVRPAGADIWAFFAKKPRLSGGVTGSLEMGEISRGG
jgi:hypothetical protein